MRGLLAVAACAFALALAGCGGDDTAAPTEVVLVTHDSFALPKQVKSAFERQSGLKLRILQGGDAGEALNRALLTAGDPQGDVLFGVDDNLLSRALDADLFDEYRSPQLAALDPAFTPADERVTPIDHGDVCLNVDSAWFRKRKLAPPKSIDDLVLDRYRDLLVVENPATSSPGLAFLLATIARYGDDRWQGVWRGLRANGVRVVDGWEEAYTQQFSGAAGSPGTRPVVVSYATSPAAEVIFAKTPPATPPTASIDDSCFRQVEYAGILRGAANPEGAEQLVDFMLSPRFQAALPDSMFVLPVRAGTPLPAAFRDFAVPAGEPLALPAAEIGRNRDRWIDEWTRIVLR